MPKIDKLDSLVDAMTTILTTNFDNQPKLCPRYTQGMPVIYPRYVQDLFKICQRYARDKPKKCLRYIPSYAISMNILTTDLE